MNPDSVDKDEDNRYTIEMKLLSRTTVIEIRRNIRATDVQSVNQKYHLDLDTIFLQRVS